MVRFILVDQSIERPGGHHYEYAAQMARAARAHGCEVTVATHRVFPPMHWPADAGLALPCFPFTTYGPHTFDRTIAREELAGRVRNARIPEWLRGAWNRWTERRRLADQQRRIRGFVDGCEQIWKAVPWTEGDHLFFATMSDFDFEGLVAFLSEFPASHAAQWHLQFHFDVLSGRASDYAAQRPRLETIRRRFLSMMEQVPEHSFHFYATTREMAEQYNEMRVAPFRELPYAVNPKLNALDDREAPTPLQVTCAGHARREKGRRQFKRLLSDLWDDCLTSGRIHVRIQGTPWKLRRFMPASAKLDHAHVSFVPHPLPPEEYLDLIRTSDIGLFLYDSERYRHRCSGILVEMLMAGVPVIVPAGCWLGEQISEPIQQHLSEGSRRLPTVEGPSPFAWHAAADGGARFHPTDGLTVYGREHCAVAECPLDGAPITDLIVEWKWLTPVRAGSYLRIELEQRDFDGRILDQSVRIAGRRPSLSDPVRAHFRSVPGAARLAFRVWNAYRDQPVSTDGWHLRAIDASREPGGSMPAGKVGVQFADWDQAAAALREVVRHHDHYLRSARKFSTHWGQQHLPRHALEMLLGPAPTAIDGPSNASDVGHDARSKRPTTASP